MLRAVTLKEIERVFAVTDALGISREALVIPLAPAHPGRVRLLPGGKLEIVVEASDSLDRFLESLPELIRNARG